MSKTSSESIIYEAILELFLGALGFILEPWATDPATTNPTVVPRVESAEKKRVKLRATASLLSKTSSEIIIYESIFELFLGAFGFILEPWATDPATTNPTVVPRVETAEKKIVKHRARASLWSKTSSEIITYRGRCG